MEKIPETAADISPYATSDFQTMPMNSSGSGSGGLGRNTIGRKETMRMTDYNKHKLSHPDIACSLTSRPHRVTSYSIVTRTSLRIFQDTLEAGWRSGKLGKKPRRRYSESEEYDDSDTDSERQARYILSSF